MPKVTYVQPDGTERVIDGSSGHSVMQLAIDEGVEGIVAECGGNMMCATCHVYVDPAWVDRVGDVDEGQDAMLQETVAERQDNSRLSCQIVLTDDLDGLEVRVPGEQV